MNKVRFVTATTLFDGHDAAIKRLSTAFDSVSLYGEVSHEQPDVSGKVGKPGVSVDEACEKHVIAQRLENEVQARIVDIFGNRPAPLTGGAARGPRRPRARAARGHR